MEGLGFLGKVWGVGFRVSGLGKVEVLNCFKGLWGWRPRS